MPKETQPRSAFGDAAWARVHLGMSRAEFATQTPAEWEEVVRAYFDKQKEDYERADRLVARLGLFLAINAGAKDVTEDSFMPKPIKSDEEKAADLLSRFMAATAHLEHHGN